jgi:anthranilate synthase component 2
LILIIDNYDSFTFNLYQYVGEIYGDVRVIRNDEIKLKDLSDLDIDGIILSPGPGRPENSGICIELVKEFGHKVPILGICLGHQAIGVAYGGRVIGAGEIRHGKASMISQTDDRLFRGLKRELNVMRYHSLVVDRASLPEELAITAESSDDNEIMALRHKQHEVYGVQFHPESIFTEQGKEIIKNFVEGICNVTGSNKTNS